MVTIGLWHKTRNESGSNAPPDEHIRSPEIEGTSQPISEERSELESEDISKLENEETEELVSEQNRNVETEDTGELEGESLSNGRHNSEPRSGFTCTQISDAPILHSVSLTTSEGSH